MPSRFKSKGGADAFLGKCRVRNRQQFARYVASVDDPDGWTFVYEEAGSDKELLESYPRLNNGNLVEVLGTQKGSDGAVWNMISIAGAYAGYVRADHLRRK